MAIRSRVKHSPTEPLCSLSYQCALIRACVLIGLYMVYWYYTVSALKFLTLFFTLHFVFKVDSQNFD